MKKKYYLICLTALLGCLLAMPGRVMADPTVKVIYSRQWQSLFFVYDEVTYVIGTAYSICGKYGPVAGVKEFSVTEIQNYSVSRDAAIGSQWDLIEDNIQWVKNIYFDSSFATIKPKSLQYWFRELTSLGTIYNPENLTLTDATNLRGAFEGCSSLSTFDPSGWNVSNVTDLTNTFYGCSSLTSLDLSRWDVSNVTTLEGLFMNCTNLSTLRISNWNVGKVTNMSSTFSGCKALTTLNVTGNVPEGENPQDYDGLAKWNVSKVTTLAATFSECEKLITLNIKDWDVSNVTTLESTFQYLGKNNTGYTLFTLDVSSWNVGNVTTMRNTFNSCQRTSSLGETALRNWDVSKVTDMYQTFYMCNQLRALDVSLWDVSSVTTMYRTFYNCSQLTALDVSDWNVENVETLESTFSSCNSLTTLPVDDWKVGNVTTLASTFDGCSGLTSLPVDDWDVSSVTKMSRTFFGCSSLTSLPVDNWNVSGVTDLASTFYNCSRLTALNIKDWNTSSVTNMSYTFSWCSSLKSINVKGWDFKAVTNMSNMFDNCSKLTSISFGKDFNMEKTINESSPGYSYYNYKQMFQNCPKLRYLDFYDSEDTDAITSVDRSNSNDQFYGVPLTTVIYLPKKSKDIDDVVNVVYSYDGDQSDLRCPNYYSEDKVDIEFPRNFLTKKAEYYRIMSTTYGSVILPYDFTTDSYVQAYTLDEEHIPTMYFKDTQTVPAHTPFAYKKLTTAEFRVSGDYVPKFGAQFITEDTDFSITVYATQTTSHEEEVNPGADPIVYGTPYTATTNLSGWTTKGYYIEEMVSSFSGAFYIQGDKFYMADDVLHLYPHRVTFHGTWVHPVPDDGTGTRAFEIMTISDSQIADAIDAAELRMTEREASDIYDVQGRRHNTMQRGINIVRMKDGSVRKTMVK